MHRLRVRIGLRPLVFVAVGAALLSAVAISARPDDPPTFGPWSAPVNLGKVVNSSSAYDACPTISRDGLSLYFRSDRPQHSEGGFDIWVAQRDSVDDPWERPVDLGPTINGPYHEYCSTLSPNGHWLVFVSDRPVSAGGCGGQDLWISYRRDKRDTFGWETPRNLGCNSVNSAAAENGPNWFEDKATGRVLLYFSSSRPGGQGVTDIYVSEATGDEEYPFGPPVAVAELNTAFSDYQPALRKDGLEIFFASGRPGGSGYVDLWTSTRESTLDPWSAPVNLGPVVNSAYYDFHPTLSLDGTMLIFASERGGPSDGWGDLWMTTRVRVWH